MRCVVDCVAWLLLVHAQLKLIWGLERFELGLTRRLRILSLTLENLFTPCFLIIKLKISDKVDLCNQKIAFNLGETLLIATLKMQSVDLFVDFLLVARLVLASNNQTKNCFFILSCSRYFQPSLL